MERYYTNKDIDQFFENLREITDYPLKKVYQLINNPDAKATLRVNFNYRLLKFIIMTSIIIAGVSALLLWPGSHKNVENQTFCNNQYRKSEVNLTDNNSVEVTDYQNSRSLNSSNCSISNDTLCSARNNSPDNIVQLLTDKGNEFFSEDENQNCDWPEDTIIDKDVLLVDLTDEEMKMLGIARKGYATFYHNISPDGYYDMHLGCHTDSIPKEERIISNNEFFVAYVTNIYFETNGPGSFYLSMDTLVPVITNNKAGQIFWFIPHKNFYNALPERYKYLESIYERLICLKKKNPDRVFTNFLDKAGTSVIEPVNILELSISDLQKIGVIFDDKCVIFQSKNKNYTLKKCTDGTRGGGSDEDFGEFPPNPYPVAMTDLHGRRSHVMNTIINRDSLSKIMNILIPVKIDLRKIVPPNEEILICWFYPTDEFINSLPDEIKTELKIERNAIINGDKSINSSCTYFEVCKSTLFLDGFKVYPNPANQSVNIEFITDEPLKGNISLVNISGSQIKVLLPETSFPSGKNTYQADVSDISPGIYLVSIMTDKGFKTQRIIISR
ncbi:MAG: T9SS type A sorting domain-containing protein [Bacteroidales bacterium]|nr:T9SS type A sorting domain-containing protein [Bacteroidales bacterium]